MEGFRSDAEVSEAGFYHAVMQIEKRYGVTVSVPLDMPYSCHIEVRRAGLFRYVDVFCTANEAVSAIHNAAGHMHLATDTSPLGDHHEDVVHISPSYPLGAPPFESMPRLPHPQFGDA